jgi:mono/diheme cytochrome c family protein
VSAIGLPDAGTCVAVVGDMKVATLAAIVMAGAGLAGCGSRAKPVAPIEATPVEQGIGGTPTGIDPAAYERGAYVAAIAGCVACHTAVGDDGRPAAGKAFAGGLEVRGEGGVGVARTPNITPDKTTGIGTWTDEELVRAVRTGVTHDGSRLLPVMPYPYFQRMSDGDAYALAVFLRAQEPVTRRVPPSEDLAMTPEIVTTPPRVPEPKRDSLARGEYLATMMRCAACHTNDGGALAHQPYAGGKAFDNPIASGGGTLYAANITSDVRTGIGGWSTTDVVRAVREMVRPDGTPLRGPMTMYRDGWAKLSDADAHALALYIRSIPPVENEIVHAQRQARLTRGRAQTSRP